MCFIALPAAWLRPPLAPAGVCATDRLHPNSASQTDTDSQQAQVGVPVHGLTAEALQAVDAATEAFAPAVMVGADGTDYPPGSAGGIPSTSSAGEGGTACCTLSRLVCDRHVEGCTPSDHIEPAKGVRL